MKQARLRSMLTCELLELMDYIPINNVSVMLEGVNGVY